MTLVGEFSAHPTIADGKVTETREIVWFGRTRRWARTRNRLWLLGETEGAGIAADGADLLPCTIRNRCCDIQGPADICRRAASYGATAFDFPKGGSARRGKVQVGGGAE
jgi:hypothetical protein